MWNQTQKRTNRKTKIMKRTFRFYYCWWIWIRFIRKFALFTLHIHWYGVSHSLLAVGLIWIIPHPMVEPSLHYEFCICSLCESPNDNIAWKFDWIHSCEIIRRVCLIAVLQLHEHWVSIINRPILIAVFFFLCFCPDFSHINLCVCICMCFQLKKWNSIGTVNKKNYSMNRKFMENWWMENTASVSHL